MHLIRNAFTTMGDRLLEVAATLRASPSYAFLTVALPLGGPAFLTAAVLGFGHTIAAFGVVLMIGGGIQEQSAPRLINNPGKLASIRRPQSSDTYLQSANRNPSS